jgi:hypothetical protein
MYTYTHMYMRTSDDSLGAMYMHTCTHAHQRLSLPHLVSLHQQLLATITLAQSLDLIQISVITRVMQTGPLRLMMLCRQNKTSVSVSVMQKNRRQNRVFCVHVRVCVDMCISQILLWFVCMTRGDVPDIVVDLAVRSVGASVSICMGICN